LIPVCDVEGKHMPDLSGIWVALVTPFQNHTADLSIDHAALTRLVEHLRAAKVSGVVALGSTGEAAALDDAEQDAVLDTVLQAAQDLPVMAGLAGNHVPHIHARLKHFNSLPLAGILSPAPYYVRPSQAGLIAHFTRLADASVAPIVLYDIPYRTGVTMDLDTILALAAHEQIHAIKDCGGSLDKTQALIADGRLRVLAGEDNTIFHNGCLGGHGAITAAAQVAPQPFVAMWQALQAHDLARARQWHHQLTPLIHALFAEPNPSVIKAVLAMQGLMNEDVRPPMLKAGDEAKRAVKAWLTSSSR
jgi:4-hydroxy-tetrahydrodipicolinate synthase